MRRLTRFGPFWVSVLWLLAMDLSARTPRHDRSRLDVLRTHAPPVVDVSIPIDKPGMGVIQLIPIEGPSGAKLLR